MSRLWRQVAVVAVLSTLTFGCSTDTNTASPASETTATDSGAPEDTVSPSENSTEDPAATPTETPDDDATSTEAPAVSPIGAYNVLVEDVNGFFSAASSREREQPTATPQNAEDIVELVGYEFADGVRLIEYDVSTNEICFTGPDNTYLTLSEPVDMIQRTLGTGVCNYEDGDVILKMRLTDDTSADTFVERVTKGADIAEQVPPLDRFDDVLNASLADDD